jgi:sensor domain CHASE-containing protein
MDLRKHRAVYNITVTLVFTVIFLVASFIVERKLDSYFSQLQEEATAQNVKVIEGIFEREMKSLSILNTDWGMWNEMYDYAAAPNQEFTDANLQDQSFQELDVNVIVIANEKGEILFSKQYYPQSPEEKNVDETILKSISEMQSGNNSGQAGTTIEKKIIDLGARKLILTSSLITKSDLSGESHGRVFFGRYIEKQFLKEFENVPGFYFNVSPYQPDDPEMLYPDISEANPFKVQLESRRKVIGLKLINDISGGEPFILEVEQVPTIYSKLIDIIIFAVYVLGIAYLVVLLTVLFFFNRIFSICGKCEKAAASAERESEQPNL